MFTEATHVIQSGARGSIYLTIEMHSIVSVDIESAEVLKGEILLSKPPWRQARQ